MTSSAIALSSASGFGYASPSVLSGKFPPILYGVAAGTYNSSTDNNYGVDQFVQPAIDVGGTGLPVIYQSFTGSAVVGQNTLQGNTFCNWSRQDNVISFDLCMSFLGSNSDPFPGTQYGPYELKVACPNAFSQAPQQYNLRHLPLPDPAQDSPVFDAEIVSTPFVNPSTGPRGRYLPTGTTFFKARLLKDGTFALVYISGAALQTDVPFPSSGATSFLVNGLQPAFRAGGGCNIKIRGSYFTGNNY